VFSYFVSVVPLWFHLGWRAGAKMISGCKTWGLVLLLAAAVSAGGCGSPSSGGGQGKSLDELAGAADAQAAARKQQEAAAARKAEEEKKAAEAQPVEPKKSVAGRAAVAPGGGYYKAIIGARRHILNQVDRLPWLQAVQHFQATEGRLPKDHNEFMKKIVEPLQINLGYIEEGQEFLYDPTEGQWGELYVVEKVPANGAAPGPEPPK
jgi:hypothetical protein